MAQVKLKKKVKKAWVEALRSGKYEQGKGMLNSAGYCCLGVLCEVAVESGLEVNVEPRGSYVNYDGRGAFLPNSVYEWASLKKGRTGYPEGDFVVPDPMYPGVVGLAALNDNGLSFQEIAAVIEKEL